MSEAANEEFVARALEQLGREIGVDVVGKSLIVPFDDLYECVLQPAREHARVVMESALFIVPAERRSAIFRRALSLNADPSMVAGGTIYLDRETSVLMMRAEASVGAEGGVGLGRAVAGFIEAARIFLEKIASGADSQPLAGEALFDPGMILRG